MPTTYQRADEVVADLAGQIIALYHTDLFDVKPKIDYVFAFRDPDAEEPAIVVRGHRVMGQAKINNLKHRALGLGDAEILLDGDAWADMPDNRKRALLDHELEHLEVKRHKKTGEFLYDDLQRPAMKLRDHDREFGFFDNIAGRHGVDSFEIENLRRMFREAGGEYIPGILQRDTLSDQPPAEALSGLAAKLARRNEQ